MHIFIVIVLFLYLFFCCLLLWTRFNIMCLFKKIIIQVLCAVQWWEGKCSKNAAKAKNRFSCLTNNFHYIQNVLYYYKKLYYCNYNDGWDDHYNGVMSLHFKHISLSVPLILNLLSQYTEVYSNETRFKETKCIRPGAIWSSIKN